MVVKRAGPEPEHGHEGDEAPIASACPRAPHAGGIHSGTAAGSSAGYSRFRITTLDRDGRAA